MNKKRVLLINPPYCESDENPITSSLVPPLGLGFIAASLRSKGNHVELVDMCIMDEALTAKLNTATYDVVGITGMCSDTSAMVRIASRVKEAWPDCVTVVGGPHATATNGRIIELSPHFDCAAVGHGDTQIQAIIDHLDDFNSVASQIPNLWQRIGDVVLPPTNLYHSSSSVYLNIPAFDLFFFEKYRLSKCWGELEPNIGTLISSIGCPFDCAYCSGGFSKIKYFMLPIKKIEKSINKLVKEHGVKTIIFWDDTLTFSKQRAIKIIEILKYYNVEWVCHTRADCVDSELMKFMAKSKCKTILFGVETFAGKVLSFLNRTVTKNSVIKAFSLAKANGIRTIASMMIGCPGQTPETIEKDFEILNTLKPDAVRISIFNVLPGTQIYNYSIKHGLLPRNVKWGDSELYSGPPIGLPTINDLMPREVLQLYKKKLENAFAI